MRVYLSGQMTGLPEFNFPLFNRVADELRAAGVTVENPAEHFGGDTSLPRLTYLRSDYALLTAADRRGNLKIDAIVMLPGWENSSGARSERAVAEAVGIPVFIYETEVMPYVSTQSLPAGKDLKRGKEVIHVDPVTGGRKGVKSARFDLIPAGALWDVAEVFGFGSNKYEDNNWRKGYDWKYSFGSLQRHLWEFWGGEDINEESGLPHLAHAAWHCLALATFMKEQKSKDSRWKKEA